MAVPFTKEMKRDYTILIPNMSPIHFKIAHSIFENHGYKALFLENEGPEIIQLGLRYVHNDMCYPCLLVIGQIIDAIEKKLVDKAKCAVAITQTGGGCRASNYYFLLIKALERAGLENIPVISFNLSGMNKNPGFRLTPTMILQAGAALAYGDMIMLLSNQTRPYEINKGDTERITEKWVSIISECFRKNRGYFWKNLRLKLQAIADDYAAIPRSNVKRVKTGIVGEIYMKFSKFGNSNLQGFLESEGCEVMIPPMLGFALYCLNNQIKDREYYGKSRVKAFLCGKLMIPYLESIEEWERRAISRYDFFCPPASFDELKAYGEPFIDQGCKMGEGWLLTAEMAELIDKGYENIVCTQPFGCLPNHIVGKGMIRPLKEAFSKANIVPIDYDPSATRVNQENRIKLMLAVAKEKLEESKME